MRLDKYLADMGISTRSEIKKMIRDRRVTVNGNPALKADMKVFPEDLVKLDDEVITYSEYEYYLLYKPSGYYSTVDYSPNVTELLVNARKDVMPVGRLDKDTEGLILMTNDGTLAHRLLSPKNHVEKTYYAKTEPDIPEDAAEKFAEPMRFEDFTSLPAKFERISSDEGYLTVHEGKYHQVKRMFHAAGADVIHLKRTRFGFLTLGDLEPGQYRTLQEEEIAKLKELSGTKENR
ncbi:MAG: rRNA pseudouridine synthase [Erysipelotrichales bacterium]|nr:rRNA pseudouridine synthase [Erysipelotrichales bacterium]